MNRSTEAASAAVVCEMSPRDGLQVVNRSGAIPLDDRVALVADLARAGLPYIEVGAFVSARRVPGMADTARLLERLGCRAESGPVRLGVLIPNMKYYKEFHASGGAADVAVFVSASEAYSLKNTRMSLDEALDAAVDVARAALRDGYGVRAHVSGAFRDLTADNRPTPAATVEAVCSRLRAACSTMVIALADTDGRAGPEDIERVAAHLRTAIGLDGIGVHLHDRAGSGLRNARVAWEEGIRVFDGAVGGIGGNPTALDDPVGNVATEALVDLLEGLGVRTGVDREALIDAGERIARMTEQVGDPPPPSETLRAALLRRGGAG